MEKKWNQSLQLSWLCDSRRPAGGLSSTPQLALHLALGDAMSELAESQSRLLSIRMVATDCYDLVKHLLSRWMACKRNWNREGLPTSLGKVYSPAYLEGPRGEVKAECRQKEKQDPGHLLVLGFVSGFSANAQLISSNQTWLFSVHMSKLTCPRLRLLSGRWRNCVRHVDRHKYLASREHWS